MSRSNQGFQFQVRVTRAVIKRFRNWRSVTITDGRGRIIVAADDVPLTRDGGVDVCIRIHGHLPGRTQKALETRIRNILAHEPFT